MKNILKIMLAVMLAGSIGVVAYTIFLAFTTGGTDAEIAPAIDLNLYWAYGLFAVVVIAALFGSIYGMVNSSTGLLKTILSFVAVVAVVAGAYLFATSHTVLIPNIETGKPFEAIPTIITESSVIIAYVAMAGAIVVAVVSEVVNAFK